MSVDQNMGSLKCPKCGKSLLPSEEGVIEGHTLDVVLVCEQELVKTFEVESREYTSMGFTKASDFDKGRAGFERR